MVTGKKSLFVQYLTVSLVIVLVSFVILGTMLVFFVARYSDTEKKDLLIENAQRVSQLVSEQTVIVNNNVHIGDTETSWLSGVMQTISASINADVFITDVKGNTLLCSEGSRCRHRKGTVPSDICRQASEQEIFIKTTLDNMYDEPQFLAGVPILTDVGSRQEITGIVFTATDMGTFSTFKGEIMKIFFYASVATFAIVACIIWFFSFKMIKPLRQMSIAAKKLANGDFSVRVPVSSNNEVGTLARSFNEMANSLSVSETTRRNFIANVSHELKTPMTTIAGFIDGILDGTIPQDKQKQYLRIVSNEVKRLSRLVASMLSLSRIDNGELHLNKQPFNISDVVISTLLTFEQKIEQRHIDVKGLESCMTPVTVNGDPDLIYQVVYNLFENAVKFTDKGGYIQVNLTEYADRTELEIKNSGHGIEPDELVHIFERFYKTDKSRSQDKNGMGLGLYIVKTIMHLHGGDITAQSVVDEYCSFTLWLPKDKPLNSKHIFNKAKNNTVPVISSDGKIISVVETIDETVED